MKGFCIYYYIHCMKNDLNKCICIIDGTIELLEAVTFTPGSDNTQCFDVEVEPSDDDILKENERLTLSLTSNDTSVFTSFAVIEIQDNDSK